MKTALTGLAAALMLGAASLMAENFPPERELIECSPRAGLPNFFAKLEKGGEVKVAYLGGSITEQKGWRVRSLAYFQQLYPNARLTEIYAAIGGTGAELGALRLERDVLKFKPDLLFVEFAGNNAETAPETVVSAMEGIVRKTWKTAPECDICFVYTISNKASVLLSLKNGKLNRSAASMEFVADKYGIPGIHLGVEIVRLEKEGKMLMKSPNTEMTAVNGDTLNATAKTTSDADGKIPFSADGIHPFLNTGHQFYEEAIERSIPMIRDIGTKPASHVLSAPLNPNNYENSIMLEPDKTALNGVWTKLPETDALYKQFSSRIDSLWKGEPGATLSFKFKGIRAQIYQLLGPGCGEIEITVDGKTRIAKSIDRYCNIYRLALTDLLEGQDREQIHEVFIKVLPTKLDKSKILFKSSLDDLEKNPAKYEPCDWYVGAIFINGEFLK